MTKHSWCFDCLFDSRGTIRKYIAGILCLRVAGDYNDMMARDCVIGAGTATYPEIVRVVAMMLSDLPPSDPQRDKLRQALDAAVLIDIEGFQEWLEEQSAWTLPSREPWRIGW